MCGPLSKATWNSTSGAWGSPTSLSPFTLLELNHGERSPNWLRELVEDLNLTSGAADKYIEGMGVVLAAGEMARE